MVAKNQNGLNGYDLSKRYFSFCGNEKLCKVQHTALFYYIVELNNSLNWREEFGLPTGDTMEVLSIGNKRTYLDALRDLEKWGFIEIVETAKNQHQACRIKISHSNNDTATPQRRNGNGVSTVPIVKQLNSKTDKIEEEVILLKDFENFEEAWAVYLNSAFYNVFKKKYELSDLEIKERFSTFWDYQIASDQLNFTKKECFNHFYNWHPKELKSSEESVARIPEWKKDYIKIKN